MLDSERSLQELSQRCEAETQKFRHRRPYSPEVCYDLFRRALEQEDSEAFGHIYRIYLHLVYFWLQKHPQFPQLHTPIEDCVSETLLRFYRALRGPQFAKVQSLPSVLKFMKMCVNSTVIDLLRVQARQKVERDLPENLPAPSPSPSTLPPAVWQRMVALLPVADDQLLAYLCFVLEMKPAEIVELYAHLWPDAEAVRVNRQRIRRTLADDELLRELLQ